MGYIGRYTAPSIVDLESPVSVDGTTIIENGVLKNVGIDGIKLKSSGDSITKSDGTTAVLSESDGVVTLNLDQAVIEGSSSGDLVRISQTGSGNALVVEDSENPDSTPLVIDAIGRLLIGNTNAPTGMASHSVLISNDGTASFSVDPSSDDLVIDREAGGITIYGHTGASAGRINFGTATNNAIGSVAYFHTDNSMRFEVNDQERMRIDSSGNVGIGMTTPSGLGLVAAKTRTDNLGQITAYYDSTYAWKLGTYSNGAFFIYADDTNSPGVFLNWRGTSWNSNSDERLKTGLIPIENATEKLCSLRTVTGRYLIDDESESRSFLIAQDFQETFPEPLSESPDGFLGLSYTDVIPLIVAGFKEQQAIIESQQSQIDALTAKTQEQDLTIASLISRIEALETQP